MGGTSSYASINAHLGKTQSRRDDLEAIGYVLISLLVGRLPWCDIERKNPGMDIKDVSEKMRCMKQEMPLDEMCAGCPDELKQYVDYCKALDFTERPDYEALAHIFGGLRNKEGDVSSYKVPWLKEYASTPLDVSSLSSASLPQPDDKGGRLMKMC